MHKKFILHVIPSFYPAIKFGGPNINLHRLALFMSKYQSIKVFTTDKSLNSNYKNKKIKYNNNYEVNYFKIFNNKKSKFYFSLSFIFSYLKILNKKYIVHLHTLFQFPCLFILFTNIIFKKEIIISLRGTFTNETLNKNIYRKIYKNLIKILFRITKPKIIFSSEIEFLDFKKIFNVHKHPFIIIPNGIDEEYPIFFNKDFNISKIRLLYFGRLDRKKNIHKILIELAKSKNIFLDLYVFINDNKYFNEINKIIFDHKMEKRIKFQTPFQDKNDLKNIIKKYDFSIFLSEKENFCNSALESIFFGLPTIMNNNIGLSHYLRPNKDFLLINEFNYINKVMNAITNDKILSLKRSMQKKACIFNMSDVSKEYFKFYNLGSNNL